MAQIRFCFTPVVVNNLREVIINVCFHNEVGLISQLSNWHMVNKTCHVRF
jgi:hypothetical protein